MVDLEKHYIINSGEQNDAPQEADAVEEDANVDIYFAPKYMTALSASMAFIANVESVVGWEAASTNTLRVAGATALGAAIGAVSGFFLKDKLLEQDQSN